MLYNIIVYACIFAVIRVMVELVKACRRPPTVVIAPEIVEVDEVEEADDDIDWEATARMFGRQIQELKAQLATYEALASEASPEPVIVEARLIPQEPPLDDPRYRWGQGARRR